MTNKLNLAIFASGTGSNAEAIIHYSFREAASYRVALLVSNNSQCLALQRAMMFAIPTLHISSTTHPNESEYSHALLNELRTHSVEIIALAGFMKKMPTDVIQAFPHRIFNIHPALLPKFGGHGMYGANVHRAVIEAGEHESGLTIHEVDADYDSGKVFAQKTVEVLAGDTPETLAHRINEWECEIYPESLHQAALEIKRGER